MRIAALGLTSRPTPAAVSGSTGKTVAPMIRTVALTIRSRSTDPTIRTAAIERCGVWRLLFAGWQRKQSIEAVLVSGRGRLRSSVARKLYNEALHLSKAFR